MFIYYCFVFSFVCVVFVVLFLFVVEVGLDCGMLVVVGGGGNIEELLYCFVEFVGGCFVFVVVILIVNGVLSYD